MKPFIFVVAFVQLLSLVQLFVTPWTAHARPLGPSSSPRVCITKFMSIKPSHPLLPPSPPALSLFSSVRVFSTESALGIRWPKYWSFSYSICTFNEYLSWFPLGLTGWISFQSKGLLRVFSNTTVQKHSFFSAQLSEHFLSNSHIQHDYWKNHSLD